MHPIDCVALRAAFPWAGDGPKHNYVRVGSWRRTHLLRGGHARRRCVGDAERASSSLPAGRAVGIRCARHMGAGRLRCGLSGTAVQGRTMVVGFRSGQSPAPWQGTGACFFKKVGYDGQYFCMSRGQRIDRLPDNFNSAISSIQILRARSVIVYGQNYYQGRSARVPDSIPNLKLVADSGDRQELEQPDFVDSRGLSSATGAVGRILF